METTKTTTAGELLDQMWDKITEYVKRINPKGARLTSFQSWLFWELPTNWQKASNVFFGLVIIRLKQEGLVKFTSDKRGIKFMIPVR